MEKETNNTQIQIAVRLKGEHAEKVKAMAMAEDRTFAYIAARLIKEALQNVELAE